MDDAKFKNWIRSAYGFKLMKNGIQSFVDNYITTRHEELQKTLQHNRNAKPCNVCTTSNLLPDHGTKGCNNKFQNNCFCKKERKKRRPCPNNFCSYFYHLVVDDHEEHSPRWTSTDPGQWYNDYVQYAKCYLSTPSPATTLDGLDCAGLLSIMIHNLYIRKFIHDVENLRQCRKDRNEIFHASELHLTDGEFIRYIDNMINALEDKTCLINDQKAKEAVENLKRLKTTNISITYDDTVEFVRQAKEAIKELCSEVKEDIEARRRMFLEDLDDTYVNAIYAIDSKKHESLNEIDKQTEANLRKMKKAEKPNENDIKQVKQTLIALYERDCSMLDVSPLLDNETEPMLDIYQCPSLFHVDYHRDKSSSNNTGMGRLAANRDQACSNNEELKSLAEIFSYKGTQCKHIFITGDVGVGKTSFCKYLCYLWCLPNDNSRIDGEMSKHKDILSKFDFIFLVTLRDTDGTDTISVIVEQLFYTQNEKKGNEMYAIIEHILMHRTCLLIMDGYDEWSPNISGKGSHVLPSKPLSNTCTYLTTCRPYKIENERLPHNDIDHQVCITGICESYSRKYVEKVIKYLNNENKDSKHVSDFDEDIMKFDLKELLQIPILASHLVLLWFHERLCDMPRSWIYSLVLDMLFKRAQKLGVSLPKTEESQIELPNNLFAKLECLNDYVPLLRKICLLAFRSLLKLDEHASMLVFTELQLTREPYSLKEEEIKGLCKIGILSTSKVIGCFLEKKQKLSFLHKSYLEFLAAMYMSSFDPEDGCLNIILDKLSQLSDVQQYYHFCILLSGLSGEKTNKLFDKINDKFANDLNMYRKQVFPNGLFSPLLTLQGIIMSCNKELSFIDDASPELKVRDICSFYTDDRSLKQIILKNKNCIKSLQVTRGEYLEEYNVLNELQCLHIYSLKQSSYSNLMHLLKNNSLLETISIACSESVLSPLPLSQHKYLTSIAISAVKMQLNSLTFLVSYINDNIQIENIRLQSISISDLNEFPNHDMPVLNLQNHTKLAFLCLDRVNNNISCHKVNNTSLQHIILQPLSENVLSYIELINCIKGSQCKSITWKNCLDAAPMLNNDTIVTLLQTVRTLAKIKHVVLRDITLPDTQVLQLHNDVKEARITMFGVSMSKRCFHDFIKHLDYHHGVIKVKLLWCSLSDYDASPDNIDTSPGNNKMPGDISFFFTEFADFLKFRFKTEHYRYIKDYLSKFPNIDISLFIPNNGVISFQTRK
ncbi:hypothetical protein ACF0H5_021340 [Mactra antiquata]